MTEHDLQNMIRAELSRGALSLLTNLLEQHADKINKLVEGMCKNEQNQHRRSPKN